MSSGARIFISYRRQDSGGIARELYAALRERLAADVFMDVDSIAPGASFPAALEVALVSSQVVLVLIGPGWLTDRLSAAEDFVRREIAGALSRGISVIPVLVSGAHMPAADELPEELAPLATLQAVELPCAERVRDLTRAIQQRVPEPEPESPDPRGSRLISEVDQWQQNAAEAMETERLRLLRQSGLEPQLVIQEGHYSGVSAVAFRRDNRLLASGSYDGTARIWDFHTGDVLCVCAGDKSYVRTVSFSPDGGWLATAGFDRALRIWECPGGRVVTAVEVEREPTHVQFSPDRRKLLSAGAELGVWDTATWKLLFRVDGIEYAAFSPDSNTIAAVDGTTLRLLDGHTGEVEKAVKVEDGQSWRPLANFAAYTPDGAAVITTGHSPAVWFWDAATLKRKRTIEAGRVSVSDLALSPDGSRFALTSGCTDDLEIWDVHYGRMLTSAHCSTGLQRPAFSPDGQFVACASGVGVHIFDAEGCLVRSLGLPFDYDPCGKAERVETSAAVTPDRKTVVTGVGGSARRIWDSETSALWRTLERTFTHMGGGFNAVRFSADSKRAILGYWSSFDLVDLESGSVTSLPHPEFGAPKPCVVLSADGQMIGTTGGSIAEVCSASTCRVLQRIRPRRGCPRSVAFNPVNGVMALGCDGGAIELRDPETGQDMGELEDCGCEVLALDFRRDGKVLASGDSAGRVLLWDMDPLRLLGETGSHKDACVEVVYSPNGALLASRGRSEDFVNLWDAANATLVRRIPELPDVLGMYFTADGRMLALLHQINRKDPIHLMDAITTLAPLDVGQPAIVVRAFEDGEWLAFDRGGRFTGSKYPTRRVGWRVGDCVFHLKTLSDEHFARGLVRAYLE